MKGSKTQRNPGFQTVPHHHRRRSVVTGISAITPVGQSVSETWEALKAGKSGATRITVLDASPYPCQIGCELGDFQPEQHIPRKKLRHMASSSQLAVIAAGQAIDDAGLELDTMDRDRIGVIIGTAGGSTVEEVEQATRQLLSEKSRKLSPFQILRFWPNMPAFFIAESYNIRGYNNTVVTACASGSQAIGDAARMIQYGKAEVILAGGTEYLVSETTLAGFTAMRALSTSWNDEPEKAMRPFDANRDGFIPGGGCAILIIEEYEHARARDAHIYAEVLGSGISNDAYNMIIPDPEGNGAALAIQQALDDANVPIEDIDYINAHGTSTPLGDLSETKAIKTVFGNHAYDIPISSTKSMIGHLMGAAGAIEAVVGIMTMIEGIIHPTINLDTPDPDCDLDYVPNETREADVKVVLSNSFGLGGQNACLILGRV